jgi:hypothetical protein
MFLNSSSVFNTKKSRVSYLDLLLRFRIRNSVHEIARNYAELNSGKFSGSKVTSALSPYSAEF